MLFVKKLSECIPLLTRQCLVIYLYCNDPSIVCKHSQRPHSFTWWRHQMETFSASLAICAGNSPVPDEFPTQRPVTRTFDVFLDLRPNKRLSKQSRGWWFQTPSRPLWRHRNTIKAALSLAKRLAIALQRHRNAVLRPGYNMTPDTKL